MSSESGGKLVALGGPITFDMLEECKTHADVVFIGEAEYTWPAFIDDFKKGKQKSIYHQKEFINMGTPPFLIFIC